MKKLICSFDAVNTVMVRINRISLFYNVHIEGPIYTRPYGKLIAVIRYWQW